MAVNVGDKAPSFSLINPDEVQSWKWMHLETVKEDIAQHPQLYTEWFKIIFDKFYNFLKV